MEWVENWQTPPHAMLEEPETPLEEWKKISLVENGLCVARSALWIRGNRGLIGCFDAVEKTSAQFLMTLACEHLHKANCTEIIAPVSGSTWFNYRWATFSNGEKGFPGEPESFNPYADWAKEVGFETAFCYVSSIHSSNTFDPKSEILKEKFSQLHISHPTTATIEENLKNIYTLAHVAFSKNPLFESITWEHFAGLYRQLLQRIPREWIWLAHDQEELVGFLLCYPDEHCIVAKTIAIDPTRKYAGLGRWLVNLLYKKARAQGMTKIIHGLMWDQNQSRNLGSQGNIFRRYEVMRKTL